MGFNALGIFLLIVTLFGIGFSGLSRKLPFKNKKINFSLRQIRPQAITLSLVFNFLIICFFLIFFQHPGISAHGALQAEKENKYYFSYPYHLQEAQKTNDYKHIYLSIQQHHLIETGHKEEYFDEALIGSDPFPREQLEEMLNSYMAEKKDLGHIGLISRNLAHEMYLDENEAHFKALHFPRKKFVSLLHSFCFPEDSQAAENYRQEEIQHQGELALTTEMAEKVWLKRDVNRLIPYYTNEQTKNYLSAETRKNLAWSSSDYLAYITYAFSAIFENIQISHLLSILSLYGAWAWCLFAFARSAFRKKTLLAGIILSGLILCTLRNSLFLHPPTLPSTSGEYVPFLSFLLHSGLIHLGILIPLFFLPRLQKVKLEPLEYLIYPSWVALFFYLFDQFQTGASGSSSYLYEKGLFLLLQHLCSTTLIGFCLLKKPFGVHSPRPVFRLLLGACFIYLHALQDYLLHSNENLAWVLFIIVLLIQISAFTHFLNNCLNYSPYFTQVFRIHPGHVAINMIACFVFFFGICAIENGIWFGKAMVFLILIQLLFTYICPLYFLYNRMQRIDIFNGFYEPFPFKKLGSPMFYLSDENPHYATLLQQSISLLPHGKFTKNIQAILPAKGLISGRFHLRNYSGYLSIDLEVPNQGELKFIRLYCRTDKPHQLLSPEKSTIVRVYKESKTQKSGIEFLDYAAVQLALPEISELPGRNSFYS